MAITGSLLAATAWVAGTAATDRDILTGEPKNTAKNSSQAQEQAKASNDAAIQQVKNAQVNASTNAQATIQKRVAGMSNTIYTSPLGIQTQADTAKKTLLGQ